MLLDSGLSCDQCAMRVRENQHIKPLCKTPQGCPIEAEASSILISRLIRSYSNYKRLQMSGSPDFLMRDALAESELLYYGYDLIINMDEIHAEFIHRIKLEQQEQAERDRKSGGRKFNG